MRKPPLTFLSLLLIALLLLLAPRGLCATSEPLTTGAQSSAATSCSSSHTREPCPQREEPQSSWVPPRASPVLVQALMVALALAVPTGVVLSIVLCTGRPSCLLGNGPEPDPCNDEDEDDENDDDDAIPQTFTHPHHNTLLKSV